MLVLLSYIYEETGHLKAEMEEFAARVRSFKKGDEWMAALNADFIPVPADAFDHPVPSSLALAEWGLLRSDILLGREHVARKYGEPLNNDFLNVVGLLANGLFHVVEAPERMSWANWPVNSLQKKGPQVRDCYRGVCREVAPVGRY
jgi:hypothetical protein